MAKFGAAYGVRTGIHVGVDVLINRLSRPSRQVRPHRAAAPARCSPASSARWARTSSGRTARTTPSSRSAWIPATFRGADHARPRVADLDRLLGHPAGFLPDVLPLPAGDGGASSAPASCRTTTMATSKAWRGSRRERAARGRSLRCGRQPPARGRKRRPASKR
jgi:hypothetical protein